MKIFLEISEIETIRNALYSHRDSLEKSYESRPSNKESKTITDICDEAKARMSKLIVFFNDIINKENE